MNEPMSIPHMSKSEVDCKVAKEVVPKKRLKGKSCLRKTCPGTKTLKREICYLMERLERAENRMLNAAQIIQHISTMNNIQQKIATMEPYPHYSEGEEIRQHLWDMEKRISTLQTYYTRLTNKSTLIERLREELDVIAMQRNEKLPSRNSPEIPASSEDTHVASRVSQVLEKMYEIVKSSSVKKGDSIDRIREKLESMIKEEERKESTSRNKHGSSENHRISSLCKMVSDPGKPVTSSSKHGSTASSKHGSTASSKHGSTVSSKRASLSKKRGTSMDLDLDKVYVIPPGSPSTHTIVSLKLSLLDIRQNLTRSQDKIHQYPIHRRVSSLLSSPTLKILGGNVTVRELLHNIRESISQARDKFCQTRRTMFQLSKLLIHIKDSVALDSLCHCSKEMDNMKSALNALTGGQYESGGKVDFVHNKRLRQSEESLRDFDSRMRRIGSVNMRIDRFNRHVRELESNLSILFGRLDAGLPLRSGVNDNPTKINKLFNTIGVLEQNVKDISRVPVQLKESEIQRDAAVDAIEEYVELLSIIKLDKIDLEHAIGEKAHSEELKKKVSQFQLAAKKTAFHMVIDHNIELSLDREEQRKKVATAVKDVLDTKISLKELLQFEKFLNKKFRELTEEIQMTPKVRHQVIAAATRKMLSKETPLLCPQCIARLQATQPPSPRGGLMPYHAYELRALQKRQLRLYGLSNMKLPENKFPLHWNEILEKQCPQRKRRHPERYCGGKYTVTNSEQRRTRPIPCDESPLCHYEDIEQLERQKFQKQLEEYLLHKLNEKMDEVQGKHGFEEELKQDLYNKVMSKIE